jgi:hypothetical protein
MSVPMGWMRLASAFSAMTPTRHACSGRAA